MNTQKIINEMVRRGAYFKKRLTASEINSDGFRFGGHNINTLRYLSASAIKDGSSGDLLVFKVIQIQNPEDCDLPFPHNAHFREVVIQEDTTDNDYYCHSYSEHNWSIPQTVEQNPKSDVTYCKYDEEFEITSCSHICGCVCESGWTLATQWVPCYSEEGRLYINPFDDLARSKPMGFLDKDLLMQDRWNGKLFKQMEKYGEKIEYVEKIA